MDTRRLKPGIIRTKRSVFVLACASFFVLTKFTACIATDSGFEISKAHNDSFLRGASSFVAPGVGQWMNSDHPKDRYHFTAGVSLALASILIVALVPYHAQSGGIDPLKRMAIGTVVLLNFSFHTYSGLDAFQQSEKSDRQPPR